MGGRGVAPFTFPPLVGMTQTKSPVFVSFMYFASSSCNTSEYIGRLRKCGGQKKSI